MTTPHTVLREVVDRFLRARAQAAAQAIELTPTVDVFESGLLDSMSLIELVAAVEQRVGAEVDMLSIDPSSISSVDDLVGQLAGALPAQ